MLSLGLPCAAAGDGSAHSRASASDKKNVMRPDFHEYRLAAALGKVLASTRTLSVAHSVKNRVRMQELVSFTCLFPADASLQPPRSARRSRITACSPVS